MKKTQTIQGRLLKGNMLIILVIMILTTIVFNVIINIFLTKTITGQLKYIVEKTSHIAEKVGPDLMGKDPPPPDSKLSNASSVKKDDGSIYFMLDRSLRDSLSVINADYMLLDSNYDLIDTYPNDYFMAFKSYLENMNALLRSEMDLERIAEDPVMHDFKYESHHYRAVVKEVMLEDSVTYLVIFAGLDQIRSIQVGINLILMVIALVMIGIGFIMAVHSAKKIAKPFSTINHHLRNMAQRNFATEIEEPMMDELKEFVQNINDLSEHLNQHDIAQKLFFQNISHDLRTPLMTVNSYAEAILYDVMEPKDSAKIIVQEGNRMKKMVDDLLFLARLDADVDLPMETVKISELLEHMQTVYAPIGKEKGITVSLDHDGSDTALFCNKESLERCFANILSNSLKYAGSRIEIKIGHMMGKLSILIRDDGNGFEEGILEEVFIRFKKGSNGNVGLGLAIVNDIIAKHRGNIKVYNDGGAVIAIDFVL